MSLITYVVEFLGTFIYIYAFIQSDKFKSIQPFMIAAGFIIAKVMFGSVSGGHFNPAVTVMMYAKGDHLVAHPEDVFGYIAAQILGGIVAWKTYSLINEKNNNYDIGL